MHISSKIKTALRWVSLLLMVIPVSIWTIWIYVFESNSGASQADKVKLFNDWFPGLISNNISGIILSVSVIALVLALVSMPAKFQRDKSINLLVIIFSSLLILLTFFSLL